MAELVTIPNSLFEYSCEFERPIIALWLSRANIVQAVFDSLIPWGVNVDSVEARNEGKPADQGVAFRLPDRKITVFFGPAKFSFTKDAADWSEVESVIAILDAARAALLGESGAMIKAQKTTIILHVQPKTKSFREILLPFWSASLMDIHHEVVKTGAIILRWKSAGLTLDGSGVLANGVFIKMEREFAESVSYADMATTLRSDEETVFARLDIAEEEQS